MQGEEKGPGWWLYQCLRDERDRWVRDYPMGGREALESVVTLLADTVLRLTRKATAVQCAEMRDWLHKAVEEMPLGGEVEDAGSAP